MQCFQFCLFMKFEPGMNSILNPKLDQINWFPDFSYSRFCESAIKVQSRQQMTHFYNYGSCLMRQFVLAFQPGVCGNNINASGSPLHIFPLKRSQRVQLSSKSVSHNSFCLGCRRCWFYDIIKLNMMSWLPDHRKDGAALSHISWPPKSVFGFKQCLLFDVVFRE